jgi:hypothetical protein
MIKIITKARGVMRKLSDKTRWGLYFPARYPITIAEKAHRRIYFRNSRLNLSITGRTILLTYIIRYLYCPTIIAQHENKCTKKSVVIRDTIRTG